MLDRIEASLAHERAFVLVPWSRLAPEALLRTGPTVDAPVRRVVDVLGELDASGVRTGPEWSPTW